MQFGAKKFFTLVFTFLLAWLSLRFVVPLMAPFLLGLVLALAAEPVTGLLCKKFHIPRTFSSIIGVTAAFFFFSILLLLVCAFLLRELRMLANILPQLESTMYSGLTLLQTWLLKFASRMPDSIRPLIQENTAVLFSDGTGFLNQAIRYLMEFGGNLLSHIPNSALTFGTAILSSYMISAKLPGIRTWILRRFSKERIHAIVHTLRQTKGVLSGWLMAQCKLMGVTFCILFLGFVILRIPNALFWAGGVSLVDAFPVLGTGTILIPWALISLLQENTARAIGLAGIYVTVSLTRSGLEPKLIGRHLNLDPLITLIVMYAGFKLWGIGGMILAPLLTVTTLQILPDQKKKA